MIWSGSASRSPPGGASTCRSTTATSGAPVCLPEAALAELAAVLASPAIAKHAHDVKTLEVLLAAARA